VDWIKLAKDKVLVSTFGLHEIRKIVLSAERQSDSKGVIYSMHLEI
jgi:hypothetical protein